jgi:hypothetical protein
VSFAVVASSTPDFVHRSVGGVAQAARTTGNTNAKQLRMAITSV